TARWGRGSPAPLASSLHGVNLRPPTRARCITRTSVSCPRALAFTARDEGWPRADGWEAWWAAPAGWWARAAERAWRWALAAWPAAARATQGGRRGSARLECVDARLPRAVRRSRRRPPARRARCRWPRRPHRSYRRPVPRWRAWPKDRTGSRRH